MIDIRFSLYPLREDFVPLILGAIDGLDRFGVERETDDVSTLLTGAEPAVFAAVRVAFGRVASSGAPVALRGTLLAGESGALGASGGDAGAGGGGDDLLGGEEGWPPEAYGLPERVSAQFALYPLGTDATPDAVHAAIERARRAGITVVERPLCTHLYGRGADVFDALRDAFAAARSRAPHVAMTIALVANGPG